MMECLAHSAPADFADVLDRPVWTSLTGCHAGFALGRGGARRLLVEAGPFAAAQDDRPESIEALERLILTHGGEATLIQAGEAPAPRVLSTSATARAVQMIASNVLQPGICDDAVRLTAADAPEMQALATLAKPGPFGVLTHLLGRFWGIRRGHRLIAMAGERLRQPGFTEISAVSVHPDYRGQRLGPALVRHVAVHIVARGDIPYLHVLEDNIAARRVYDRLGFRVRNDMTVTWLTAETDANKTRADGEFLEECNVSEET